MTVLRSDNNNYTPLTLIMLQKNKSFCVTLYLSSVSNVLHTIYLLESGLTIKIFIIFLTLIFFRLFNSIYLISKLNYYFPTSQVFKYYFALHTYLNITKI